MFICAEVTGVEKLRKRDASRRVARAGRYRRAGFMAGSFRIQSPKKMLLGKKAAFTRVSNGGEYESPKLFTKRSFMACVFALPKAFRNWSYSIVKFASFGELFPGDGFR